MGLAFVRGLAPRSLVQVFQNHDGRVTKHTERTHFWYEYAAC